MSISTASTTNTASKNNQSETRQDLNRFFELLKSKGCHYCLGWCWEGGSTGRRGANRDGVLSVYSSEGLRVIRVQFERSTMSWGAGDDELNRLRDGSNRHYAVLEAIDELKKMA